jgi:3',5'-cyclic AMP phosphodiesterase CpdA
MAEYKRIVILGDPHLPGRLYQQKVKVIEAINSWNDVDLVVSVGDVCSTFGTAEEYEAVKRFFARLEKPFISLIGNHDNYYSDRGFISASKEERLQKFERFRKTFNGQELYFSEDFGDWRFYYLALDGIESGFYSAVSAEQVDWFKSELKTYKDKKAAVFCHAPLWTEEVINLYPPAINYIVQPARDFKKIALDNPQIKIWVSGHVHFGMIKELVMHSFNHYEQKVMNIVNTDMDGFSVLSTNIHPEYHERIWTRSLYFYQDKVICKTYDHNDQKELTELEMEIEA